MPINTLSQANGFTARIHTEETTIEVAEQKVVLENPTKIDVVQEGSEEAVLTLDTDAVDCMGFADETEAFYQLTSEQQIIAATALKAALTNYYGGKDLLLCDSSLESVVEAAGFSSIPKVPNGNTYKRLMHNSSQVLDKQLQAFYTQLNDLLNSLNQAHKLEITSDKEKLLTLTEELSQLFLVNAPYAKSDDFSKQRAYSAPAMKLRINNPNAFSFAAFCDGKLVGFMRAYVNKKNQYAYVGDLVVAESHRNKGIALALKAEAHKALGEAVKDVFVVAGDDKEEAFYKDILGFDNVYLKAEKSPLKLTNNRSFFFALVPQQQLLKGLIGKLPVGEVKAEENTQVSTASSGL